MTICLTPFNITVGISWCAELLFYNKVHLVVAKGKLKLRPRHNCYHFAYNIFKYIFLDENGYILIEI